MREQLGAFDPEKQKDDEYYAGLIDEWADRANLDDWLAWSSHILSADHPTMAVDMDKSLEDLRGWMLSRIWPGRYPALEKSFFNFRLVLQDFHNLFRKYGELPYPDSDCLYTRKFYQIPQWDPQLYAKLSKQYEYHVALVEDLMLELSRAGNLICDEVRSSILPSFRLDEGRLVVQSGPHMDLTFKDFIVQYTEDDLVNDPIYPGLDDFKSLRSTRDCAFGEG